MLQRKSQRARGQPEGVASPQPSGGCTSRGSEHLKFLWNKQQNAVYLLVKRCQNIVTDLTKIPVLKMGFQKKMLLFFIIM